MTMKSQKKQKQPKFGDITPAEKRIQSFDPAPAPEQIRQRANEIHRARGGASGKDLFDANQQPSSWNHWGLNE